MYLEVVFFFFIKLELVLLKDKFECSFMILFWGGRVVFTESVMCFAHCLCTILLRYIRVLARDVHRDKDSILRDFCCFYEVDKVGRIL